MRHPGACVSWKRAPTEGGIIRENTSTGTTRQLRACTIWERELVEGMCQRRRRHPMGRLGRECVPAACAHRPPSFFGEGTHTFAPSPHTPFCLLAAHVSITRPITKPAKEVVERRLAKVEMKAKKQKRPGAEDHAKGVRGWASPPRPPYMTGFGARALRNAGSFCRSAERRDEQRHLACRHPQNAASSLLPSAERSIEPASAERQH